MHGRWRERVRPPGVEALFSVVLAVLVWIIGIRPLGDNSFLLHRVAGHWILDNGIPRKDFFSFTASGRPWVVQSWLADVIYAGVDTVAGPLGIRVLQAAVGVLIAVLVYRLAVRTAQAPVRAAGLTAVALGASFTLWSPRPLLLGVLAAVLLIWVVELPDSLVGRYPLVSVPLIIWPWANIHGTFALGFLYLVLHLAGCWLDGRPPWQGRERTLALSGATAFLLCFANPYGPALLTFPLQLLSRGEVLQEIVEWSSPDFRTLQGITFALWLVVFIGGVALAPRRPSRRDLVVAIPFLLLGLWAQRNIVLAPLVGLPIIARLVAADVQAPALLRRLSPPVIGMFAILAALSTVSSVREPDFALDDRYPVRAMQAVRDGGLLGRRLLTTDLWGAYVIHAYWPAQRVFMDDRYDMYPVDVVMDHRRLLHGTPSWQSILDRRGIEVVVWPDHLPLTSFLRDAPGWKQAYRDAQATVFTRA